MKHNDGTMKEIQEDEVLFEKIDEDLACYHFQKILV